MWPMIFTEEESALINRKLPSPVLACDRLWGCAAMAEILGGFLAFGLTYEAAPFVAVIGLAFSVDGILMSRPSYALVRAVRHVITRESKPRPVEPTTVTTTSTRDKITP